MSNRAAATLPSSWKWAVSGEVIDVRDGTHDTPAYQEDGIPLVTSKNLKPNGIEFENIGYISIRDHLKISKRSKVEKNDILFAMIGTIGNPVIVEEVREFSIKNVALFKCGDGKVAPRYFLHLLGSQLVRNQLDEATRGGTQKFVSLNVLRGLQIPLPPLAEQQRIAEVLDRAEAMRAKRRIALAELDSLTQSLFLDLFGDPVTNPKGWELGTIGDELTLQGGYAFKSSDYIKAGVRLVKISNVHKDNLEWSDADHLPTGHLEEYCDFSLSSGDVVLALTRPIIKSLNSVKIAVVQSADVPCLLNQRVGRFRFSSNSRLSPAYLLEYCRTKTFFHAVQAFCSESLQPNMSTSQVESIKIAVPPISLQREFARRVTAVEALKTAQRGSLAELDALFGALQHRAFRGEL